MVDIIKPTQSQRESFDDILCTLDAALAVLTAEYGITVPVDSHLGKSCNEIHSEIERNRGTNPIVERPNMFTVL